MLESLSPSEKKRKEKPNLWGCDMEESASRNCIASPGTQQKSSWWLNQPISKILVKLGSSSPGTGENKKYLKPILSSILSVRLEMLQFPVNRVEFHLQKIVV